MDNRGRGALLAIIVVLTGVDVPRCSAPRNVPAIPRGTGPVADDRKTMNGKGEPDAMAQSARDNRKLGH